GKWGTLVLAQPLIPGSGWGNQLQWSQLRAAAPRSPEELEAATWDALRSYLQAYRQELNIELEQLGAAPNVAVHDQGRLIQIRAARQVNGVTVRDSFLTATINSGNLILLGTRNWGAVRVSTAATVSKQEAVATLESYIAPHRIASTWHEPSLSLIPTAKVDRLDQVQAGDGYAYRLAWAIGVRIEGDAGSWEALVDAHSGELIAFADQNQYATRRVVGGIYPVSNDGGSTDGIPDGVEQPGHPMPFADVVLPDGTMLTTGSGGLVDAEGPFGTTLSGSFVRINDNCGFIAEATSCTDLDLGSGPGTDCTVPAGDHSLGDTHSARTGFYELNRIIEQAKGWADPVVPPQPWLGSQLTANMNINNACNAFFSPTDGTVNFYRYGVIGSNECRNTGEIAAVFDHEWGHGLDFNDSSPGISSPGEAYADIAAIVRLNTSCIGRGFWIHNARRADLAGLCDGFGDLCTECSGVREVDWLKHASGAPHGIDWVQANCGAIVPIPLQAGPCAQGTHCEGHIVGEAFWDLIKRDLPCSGIGWENVSGSVGGGRCVGGAPRTIDDNTALELVARLFYQA
ncbi:MAG TPA: hypothetical protein VGA66_15845, partial [Mycobacterium sp.]